MQEKGHDLPQAFADREMDGAISGRIDCLVNDIACDRCASYLFTSILFLQ